MNFLLSPSPFVGTRRLVGRSRSGARGWGGVVLVSGLLFGLVPGQVGWAQQQAAPRPALADAVEITIPDLRTADEAAVQGEWVKLQAALRAAEALDPAAVIPLYGQFLDQGGDRFGGVALSVVSRVGRLYSADLRQFDKALEGYDWAIAVYPQHPDLVRIRQERHAVEGEQQHQAQRRAGTEILAVAPVKVALPSTQAVPGAPLAVPAITALQTPVAAQWPIVPAITSLKMLDAAQWPPVPPLKVALPDFAAPIHPFAVSPLRLAALDLGLPARPGTYAGWQPGSGRPVTALAQGAGGELWVATEDAGVWRYETGAMAHALSVSTTKGPPSSHWVQFTARDGLGDNSVYALATDKQYRVWAGTLNHGVSVWNGKTWRNYGVLEGPLGERVFDIAVCPTDGDVWIATNAGLTRYSVAKDSWSYVTRADGLPADAVKTLAFDQAGNIIVGTPCDGLALASAADGYKSWRGVKGPEQMPLTSTGKGLPSGLINDVLVAQDGTYYVATTTGLAWSRDAGQSWAFVRGQDYAAKVKGLYGGPPVDWKESDKPDVLLAEDYVTSLAQDEKGRLWIGHWVKGSEVLEMEGGVSGGIKDVVAQEKSGFVKAILSGGSAGPLLARYDEGISPAFGAAMATAKPQTGTAVAQTLAGVTKQAIQAPQGDAATAKAARLPSPLVAPQLDELNDLLRRVRAVAAAPDGPGVVPLADDWTTQGDWLGRYGRYYARLHAMTSPTDYAWGAGAQNVPYAARIGPNTTPGDQLRYWVQWLYTDNPHSLEMPPVYYHSRLKAGLVSQQENNPATQKYRRQAEIDDHGEVYPMPHDGPHIYVSIGVPPGDYILSLYDFNKDGQDGYNRLRDYRLSLRSHPANLPLESVEGFENWPELAKGRIRDFRGGVYKRFLVRGPQTLTVQVSRNYSFNTILAGVFLDAVTEEPEPYFVSARKGRQTYTMQANLEKQSVATAAAREKRAVDLLWQELERVEQANPRWWATEGRRVYARLLPWLEKVRLQTAGDEIQELYARTATCYYQLCMFDEWEAFQKRRGLTPAREVEKSLLWDGKNNWSGRGRVSVLNVTAESEKVVQR